MEEEVIEVTKKSLSMRGTWVRQTTGEKPDFTNLKFYVKLSDGSSIKYADWESFEADGGAYTVFNSSKWSSIPGMQDITFYLRDLPDIKCTKSVKVSRTPSDIEVLSYNRTFYSNTPLLSRDFNCRIRFTDKSSKIPDSNEISVSPDFIPVNAFGKFKCYLTYTEEDLPLTVEHIINVEENTYQIKAVDSEFGLSRFVIGGKEFPKISYKTSLEDPIEIRMRAVPLTKDHKFKHWNVGPGLVDVSSPFDMETSAFIPVNMGMNTWVRAIWDTSITDEFGNTYVLEDDRLVSVELVSDEVVIPKAIKIIPSDVFQGSTIKNITFPKRLSVIEDNAFKGCVNLTHLELPQNLDTIGISAFEGCTSLKSVKFNQTSPIKIMNGAFKGCTSLTELDFLSMKDNFKSCVIGDETRDVWEGCKLRTIKITKGNFESDLGEFSTDSPFTIRAPYMTRVSMESKAATVRFRVIGTTADGLPDTISKDYTRNNAWVKTFDKTHREDSNTVYSYGHTTKYDMRESCGCYVYNDDTCHYEGYVYGLGHNTFDYNFYVCVAAKYRFTTIGSDVPFHEGEIGEGFTNWHMMDYVNDVLYPNLKNSWNVSLINNMIPLYDRRIF